MIDEKQLKYTPSHEWIRLEGDVATIGISRFAVDQLTDLIHIDLPAVGRKLQQGKSFGEVESVKAVSDIYAPVDGEVLEVNSAVANDVQILGTDPYTQGWLIKVRVDGDLAGRTDLLDYDTYQKQVVEGDH